MNAAPPLSWFGIVRLGLVQAGLGAMVVLATSTMNRVMVVELALPAIIPGALVALHYAVQVLRPRFGHGSDKGGRRTPWIVGGMAALAVGGIGAAVATAWMASSLWAGLALAVASFALVGIGVGSAGTSLLVLLAKLVAPTRRAPAASIVWLMMIAGIAVTATVAGKLLDPFSGARLVAVTTGVGGVAFVVTLAALWRVEGAAAAQPTSAEASVPFRRALRDVWSEPASRRFALFVFTSMLAYSAQELIIEPFAGAVFHLTPGESTGLNGTQHMGVLAGMLLVAIGGSLSGGFGTRAMRAWTAGGCLASAAAILLLAASSRFAPDFPLRGAVLLLGAANGAFAVSAIGAMMGLAGGGGRAGVRMGLWGAAQAVAFGAGGLFGTGASDLARLLLGTPASAYAAVFIIEAALFILAARQAALVFADAPAPARAGRSHMREAT